MERDADVGAFFVAYLLEEFKKKSGGSADYLIESWRGINQQHAGRLFGPAGVNVFIEFRKNETAWSSEFTRPSRQKWCQRLTNVPSMRDLADRCHFVAWGAGRHAELDTLLAVYSDVCSPELMPRSHGAARANTLSHTLFSHAYLQRRHGTSNRGLQEYLAFMASLMDEGPEANQNLDLEVLWLHLRDGKLLGCWIYDFFALLALAEWLDENLSNRT